MKVKTKECFMCKQEGINPPLDGIMSKGVRYDYRDTDSNGEFSKRPFRGYICDMHADGDDIISIVR